MKTMIIRPAMEIFGGRAVVCHLILGAINFYLENEKDELYRLFLLWGLTPKNVGVLREKLLRADALTVKEAHACFEVFRGILEEILPVHVSDQKMEECLSAIDRNMRAKRFDPLRLDKARRLAIDDLAMGG